jgi:hypothetical protein
MKNVLLNSLYTGALALLVTFPQVALSQQKIQSIDILSGHFSRESNNEDAAKTTNNNIYIKLYPEQWIAILYIPYPYAATVSSDTINGVFKKVKRESESGSFTRSKFDLLDEAATVHVEKYEIVKEQIQFKCGSINPCAVRFSDNYLELIKSGIINEHIVKFDHITE